MEQRRRRIADAQRAGLRNRMRDVWHVSEAKADALLEEWIQEAPDRGLGPGQIGYWVAGEDWIRERLGAQLPGAVGEVLDLDR